MFIDFVFPVTPSTDLRSLSQQFPNINFRQKDGKIMARGQEEDIAKLKVMLEHETLALGEENARMEEFFDFLALSKQDWKNRKHARDEQVKISSPSASSEVRRAIRTRIIDRLKHTCKIQAGTDVDTQYLRVIRNGDNGISVRKIVRYLDGTPRIMSFTRSAVADLPKKAGETVQFYLGNLPYDITAEEIYRLTGGAAVQIHMPKQGYCFISVRGKDIAEAAIALVQGSRYRGRCLVAHLSE